MLAVDGTRFQFDFDEEERQRRPPKVKPRIYTCHISVRAADGMEEFRAVDLRYRIKSVQETFERNVLECDLSPSIIPEEQYEPMRPLRRAGGHH